MLEAIKKFIKLIIGDTEGNVELRRNYKQFMKRVNALPKDYRFVFHKIIHYMLINGVGPDGSDLTIFTDLVDLFETSAADGKQVLDIIGSDVGGFCDEFLRASVTYIENTEKLREKLNKEVMEKFNKEGQ
jgi:DNA-binding ferritin-like protein (Dps family)